MAYRFLDHTADLGIEVEAATLDELFGEAARAFADCVTEVDALAARKRRALRVVSSDLESLLVDWLSELLFVFETRGELFSAIDAKVSRADGNWQVAASATGEAFDSERHGLKIPIKAVTYHGLEVVEKNGAWSTRIIFDT